MNYVEGENEVIYIPAIHPTSIIDLAFKMLVNDCRSKGKKLTVHLNLGHLDNVGFNLITKGGIPQLCSAHLQQTIWLTLADKVIFNHLDDYIILKDRNGPVGPTKVFKEKASA